MARTPRVNRWLGEPLPPNEKRDTCAFASAAKEAETHPRRKVVNAFVRRGAQVYATKGSTVWRRYNMPKRKDYSTAKSYDFFDEVEA